MKKQKGITLVALIVTIILLLIIAGVSINTLIGNDGILQKTTKAKETYELAQENEKETINQIEKQYLFNTGELKEGVYSSETGLIYKTLTEAIEKTTNGTIILCEDIIENITISEEKNIEINLNGKTLMGNIKNLGKSRIHSGKINTNAGNTTNIILVQDGECTIENVEVENVRKNNAIRVSGGILNFINSSSIQKYGEGGQHPIWVQKGTLNIYGGLIQLDTGETGGEAIDGEKESIINIYDGIILNLCGGKAITTGGVLNIYGGTIHSNSIDKAATVRIENTGSMNFVKGTIINENESSYTYYDYAINEKHAGGTWTKE